jgi:formate-dependent nitrite reductase membrane component NrfD
VSCAKKNQEGAAMLPDDPQTIEQKKIIKSQYIAMATAFVLFFVTAIFSILLFEGNFVKVIRMAITVGYSPVLFIGVSSIRNEISILRPKGEKQYSTGKRAVTMGVLLIASFLLNVVIAFSPLLDLLMQDFS